MPRTASRQQPRCAAGWASELFTAVACAMAIGIVGFVSACGGDGGNDSDPVRCLSAAASKTADDINSVAIEVGDSSVDAIAD